ILRVFAGAIALVLTLSTGIAIGKAKGEVKLLEPAGTGENSIFGQTIDPEALDKGANDSQNLYVIQAEAGWAERGPEGHWEITIENAPKTLWFNDRPARDSGEMDTAVFVHQWNKIFATSPPNGAIVAPDGPDGEHPTAFE